MINTTLSPLSSPTSNFPITFQIPTILSTTHFKSSNKTNAKNNGNNNNSKFVREFNLLHSKKRDKPILLQSSGICRCGRRHIMDTIATTLLQTSFASLAADEPNSSSMEMLRKIHPQRAKWLEEIYASFLNNGMKAYENEIAECKSQLFESMREKAENVLEIGVGTGPNLKYYANSVRTIFGVDPKTTMEKYARKAAEAAGLSPENFKFIQAVGEGLPLNDASVDAVIGTLVLCSVKDVRGTLQEVKRVLKPGGLYVFVEHVAAKDGTSLRLLQNLLDPLQQLLAEGCHLTRDTGKYISEAGFSSVDSSTTTASSLLYINPQLYGIAYK